MDDLTILQRPEPMDTVTDVIYQVTLENGMVLTRGSAMQDDLRVTPPPIFSESGILLAP